MSLSMKFVSLFESFFSERSLFFVDERDINTDFLLVLLRDMLNVYPDLKVILMSGRFEQVEKNEENSN